MEQNDELKTSSIRVPEALDQQVMAGLKRYNSNRSELCMRLWTLGLPALELVLGPDWAKLRIGMPEKTLESTHEAVNPDLIDEYEHAIGLIREHDSWSEERRAQHIRVLKDKRALWDAERIPNSKFKEAIDRLRSTLEIERQTWILEKKIPRVRATGRVVAHMSEQQQATYNQIQKLFTRLGVITESGREWSHGDIEEYKKVAPLLGSLEFAVKKIQDGIEGRKLRDQQQKLEEQKAKLKPAIIEAGQKLQETDKRFQELGMTRFDIAKALNADYGLGDLIAEIMQELFQEGILKYNERMLNHTLKDGKTKDCMWFNFVGVKKDTLAEPKMNP